MVSKFPYRDKLLQHGTVADMNGHQTAMLSSLGYFMGRFLWLLPKGVKVDDVEEEFQLFHNQSLDDGIQRADEAWRELGLMATEERKLFENLSTVMLGVLVIFHSNADCERVFSHLL